MTVAAEAAIRESIAAGDRSSPGARLRVMMAPDYRKDNPYQSLLAEALAAEGIDVVFPGPYRRVLPLWRAVRTRGPFDVLHLHWPESYAKGRGSFFAVLYWVKLLIDLSLVRLWGVRVVWTLHNLWPHECRHPRLERWMRRRIAMLADVTFVHGDRSRADAVAVLGCSVERTVIAPHGHYRTVYPPLSPQHRIRGRSLVDRHDVVFLFFGMMRPYKGLERLLTVWKRLHPLGARLWLMGHCPDASYQQTLEALAGGINEARIECGYRSEDEVAEAFAACDVVVLPFEQVQTSGSAVLAISYGKPVIAPRLGELPDALAGADDLLYEAGSDAGLSNAILRALNMDLDDLCRRCELAGDALDWERSAQVTAKAYRSP